MICTIFLVVLPALFAYASAYRLVKHDETFAPDVVLRISQGVVQLNCEPRLSTLINGTYPGPPIYLEPDQTTWIRVYNDADANSTIHWHGLTQSTSPFSDGTPLVSQWPIPPGHFYDYELHPTAHEAGTYFYHSHVGFQAVTAAGPLVVKDAGSPPYQYDDELIIDIGDFYRETDVMIEEMLGAVPQRWPGDPEAILINGQSGTAPNAMNAEPDASCQPHFLKVKPDTTYRMRLVGGTAISMVTLAFAEHSELLIIETDGAYVQAVPTDHVQIDSGQRFSVLFTTKSQAELDALGTTTFWAQFETRESGSSQRAYAVLSYDTSQTQSEARARRDAAIRSFGRRAIMDREEDISNKARRQDQMPTGHSWRPLQNPTATSSVPFPAQTGVNLQNPGNASLKFGDVPCIPFNPPLQLAYSEDWMEYTFINLPGSGYPPPISADEVTRRITIGWTQLASQSHGGKTVYQGNGYSWFDESSPTSVAGPSVDSPYLVDIYTYGAAAVPNYQEALANGGYDPNVQAWPALVGEVIEIVYQNEASDGGIFGAHPMHAHGGHYYDIGSGAGSYDPVANNAKMAAMGWQGSLRDTTLLYAPSHGGAPYSVNGWRAWRLRITKENIGAWMMHCHILQHMIMGQQQVWVFTDNSTVPVIGAGYVQQLEGYFTYGGDVVGSDYSQGRNGDNVKWPTVAHFFD